MNTPAHAVINLLLLARKPGQNISHRRSATIIAGALLPDLAIIRGLSALLDLRFCCLGLVCIFHHFIIARAWKWRCEHAPSL
jgi:hypothetical protein